MINRLRWRPVEPDDPVPDQDFWEVSCGFGGFYVSRETAERILETIGRVWPPRWVRFTDLFGAHVCVRVRGIQRVVESTREQRTTERRFHRAQRDERKADRRPWEDEDDDCL